MRWLLFTALLPLQKVLAIGQNATISFDDTSDSIKLASRYEYVQIAIDGADWPGVIRAAKDLAVDFGRVTGTNGTVSLIGGSNSTDHGTPIGLNAGMIIAGTIGNSPTIDSMIESGMVNVSKIQGQWEAFVSTIVPSPMPGVHEALVIAGADRRGTIFGLYDVSEQIGISPWYWFADVPWQQHDGIYALRTTKEQGSPSVKYRGFFINDEAPALTGWMNQRYAKSKYGSAFGSDFYSHVFELLLRLRANYLWPAMWGSMFNVDDLDSQPLAEEYGIVMGTSHTEPMMRATNEQTTFMKGPWQWNMNNASMYSFMQDGAERAKGHESLFTMGARGNADTALNGDDAISQLESIIENQRKILNDVYGNESSMPQMWCLYKEVQDYYDYDGLRAPDDVTLLWVDDNWGNIRRLPIGNETGRSGGAGVYYHFDYVGDPRNYKWINTIQLQRTWEQMHFAYERDAREIWIVNVGDIKPLEIPISHFFDLAYDIEQYRTPESTSWWTEQWAAREFGSELAADVAQVIMTYSNLAGKRKYESMDSSIYSIINYDEANTVIRQWQDLSAEAQDLSDRLDVEARPAYFEMILHPVLAGATVYDIHISAAKNRLYTWQGRTSANSIANHVLDQWNFDHELTQQYNQLLDGKWNHMMDQTHFYNNYWQGPMRQSTPSLYYIQLSERGLAGDLGFAVEGQNGTVPGDDKYHGNGGASLTFPPIDPYSPNRWIDIFSSGTTNATWSLEGPSYIRFSQSFGEISPSVNPSDIRVWVSVDWTRAPTGSTMARINATSSTNYGTQYEAPILYLPINNTKLPANFTSGFVESDATISMEAEHYSRMTGSSDALSYFTIPNYGKTLSGVALTDYNAPSQNTSGPSLEYDFYAFSNISRVANISLILGQSLNTIPSRPLRYAIGIDDQETKTVAYITDRPRGTSPLGWEAAVLDAAWNSTSNHTITAGKHTLKFWALEPGLILTKIVINLGGVRQSYLGPPESVRVGRK
ncbi:hypothetical protein EJ05DRAFT_503454 [Pseudovirgaria hyperparasitica]|uniref:Gylcosyl hydrolase 115 C-terminal domain-containing protein n=1 Tax=Pseudovirgaria hyperparasitica TaxID=470096 RepID=A0A6A6VZ69_9PEZI|nr:uncharacterized protein EJ05DRAFT_503454 [Pseudovirgaria hyperparasitica]KAF2755146.1 hypothetical protein EJ05DRAFT_503454 [Pseudovirgaria hyperparasitica]